MAENKKDLLDVKLFWLPIIKEISYQGKAKSISSKNQLGVFDVLPYHTNFITLIFDHLTIITPEERKITYQFRRGVLEIRRNKVNIFLGI